MSPDKVRADAKVAGDLQISRTKAAAMLMAGAVRNQLGGPLKPGQLIARDAALEYRDRDAAVSRAAGKLSPALDQWGIAVRGKVALDVGSSTGGFTQVLLDRGASKVYAVDVGRGQLDWKLRQDPRVISMERTDIRHVSGLPHPPEVVTADVSFISLRRILPHVGSLVAPKTPVVVLFKPQFEVGKAVADSFQGVITDDGIVEECLKEFSADLESQGWRLHDILVSEVRGAKGNRERLLWLSAPPPRYTEEDA